MKNLILSLTLLFSILALGCSDDEYRRVFPGSAADNNMENHPEDAVVKTKIVITKETKEVMIGVASIKTIEKFESEGFHWPYGKSLVTLIDGTPYHTDETMQELQDKIKWGHAVITIHCSWENQKAVPLDNPTDCGKIKESIK